ncbi:MAG: LarC family nickel insertion protein, partial [Polyangiaceae bacterium]|nr:LarC family nickel insertion protein [Polyangiaceae bacterium]
MSEESHSGGHSHSHGGHSHGHGVENAQGFTAQGPAAQLSPLEEASIQSVSGQQRVLYLDCQSGIAGDMFVGALIDLGVPVAVLEEAIHGLGLDGIRYEILRGYSGAISTLKFNVFEETKQPARSFAQIRTLLQKSALSKAVVERALRIFERLGRAEAKVHDTTLEEVEFHEVGAVDSIVDIVGAAALLDWLDACVVVSPLPISRGYVECQHGRIPLPAPATLLCLEGLAIVDSGLECELVTPTGAAIVGAEAQVSGGFPAMQVQALGWGAGQRGLGDRPNALRVVLGVKPTSQEEQTSSATGRETLPLILGETNLDDESPECIAFTIEALLNAGAL